LEINCSAGELGKGHVESAKGKLDGKKLVIDYEILTFS
jgi:hypothetical protein